MSNKQIIIHLIAKYHLIKINITQYHFLERKKLIYLGINFATPSISAFNCSLFSPTSSSWWDCSSCSLFHFSGLFSFNRRHRSGNRQLYVGWGVMKFLMETCSKEICHQTNLSCCVEVSNNGYQAHFTSSINRQFTLINRVIDVILTLSAANWPPTSFTLQAVLLVNFL